MLLTLHSCDNTCRLVMISLSSTNMFDVITHNLQSETVISANTSDNFIVPPQLQTNQSLTGCMYLLLVIHQHDICFSNDAIVRLQEGF